MLFRSDFKERPKPRKKPREEPGYVGRPVLFWLCRVEIITEHGQDVQMFINDQHGQIIIIPVVVEGAASQHLRIKCGPSVAQLVEHGACNARLVGSIPGTTHT